MKICLGLNFSHDTSACIIIDGQIIAAEEERWSKIKHNTATRNDEFLFPTKSLQFCLDKIGVSLEQVNTVVGVSMHPHHRMGENDEIIRRLLPGEIRNRIQFISHHKAHILSGFNMIDEERAIGLCVDGAGSIVGNDWNQRERITGYFLHGTEVKKIYSVSESYERMDDQGRLVKHKHSLGNFYLNFATRLVPPGDEPQGTMMAMSSFYRSDKYYSSVKRLVELKDEGVVRIKGNLGKREFEGGITIDGLDLTVKDVSLFPFKTRCQIAYAVQKVFEETILHIADHLVGITGCSTLILSGGCALNSKLNGILKERCRLEEVYVPPAPHDAGIALGAALFGWRNIMGLKKLKMPTCSDWGPSPGKLDKKQIDTKVYEVISYVDFNNLCLDVAMLLKKKCLVCLAYQNLEFGPRALGHRSILAHPGYQDVRERVNSAKRRVACRPLAPSVIESEFNNWFIGDADFYMNKVAYIRKEQKDKVKGVLHIDNSARPQLVTPENKGIYMIIKAFWELTGIPMIMNTSLNLKGAPIAMTANDAFGVMDYLKLDALVIDTDIVIRKDVLAELKNEP